MAQYHEHAKKLQPLVDKANFTAEQLNTIKRMMENCSQLRQQKVIGSFFELMVDTEKFEIVADENNPVTWAKGTFIPRVVINKGDPIPEARQQADPEVKEVLEAGTF